MGSVASAYVAEPYSAGSSALVPGNPAERYAGRVIEGPHSYHDEVPSRCSRARHPGVSRFVTWFKKKFPRAKRKVGSRYRCEKLPGDLGYSLHSASRALDLSLDYRKYRQFKIADRMIDLLMAPDSAGNVAALARRMGIFEIIYHCGYWTDSYEHEGSAYFQRYFMCNNDGGFKGEVLATIQHTNHVHLSFTREGAAARSSFWRPVESIALAPPPPPPEETPPPEEAPPPEAAYPDEEPPPPG